MKNMKQSMTQGSTARNQCLLAALLGSLVGAWGCGAQGDSAWDSSNEWVDLDNNPEAFNEFEVPNSLRDGQPPPAPLPVNGLDAEATELKAYGVAPSQGYAAVQIETSQAGCSAVLLNDQVLLTAAHCVDNFANGEAMTDIVYEGPGFSVTRTRKVFFYKQPGWPGPTGADFAIGAMADPLNLGSDIHFATIYRGNFGEGRQADAVGYGTTSGPLTGGVQRRVKFRSTLTEPQHVKWESVNPSTGLCPGDSGGPGVRAIGSDYVSDGTPFWESVATLTATTFTNGAQNGCNNGGRAVRVAPKLDQIQDVVEFWTPYTCQNWTSTGGVPVTDCWRRP